MRHWVAHPWCRQTLATTQAMLPMVRLMVAAMLLR
jgi:hypothetical protein